MDLMNWVTSGFFFLLIIWAWLAWNLEMIRASGQVTSLGNWDKEPLKYNNVHTQRTGWNDSTKLTITLMISL